LIGDGEYALGGSSRLRGRERLILRYALRVAVKEPMILSSLQIFQCNKASSMEGFLIYTALGAPGSGRTIGLGAWQDGIKDADDHKM